MWYRTVKYKVFEVRHMENKVLKSRRKYFISIKNKAFVFQWGNKKAVTTLVPVVFDQYNLLPIYCVAIRRLT